MGRSAEIQLSTAQSPVPGGYLRVAEEAVRMHGRCRRDDVGRVEGGDGGEQVREVAWGLRRRRATGDGLVA